MQIYAEAESRTNFICYAEAIQSYMAKPNIAEAESRTNFICYAEAIQYIWRAASNIAGKNRTTLTGGPARSNCVYQ